jgi:hypothetical protein
MEHKEIISNNIMINKRLSVNKIEKQEKDTTRKARCILKKFIEFFVFNKIKKIKDVKNKIKSMVNLKLSI